MGKGGGTICGWWECYSRDRGRVGDFVKEVKRGLERESREGVTCGTAR